MSAREGELYGRNRQDRQRQCAVKKEKEDARGFVQARRVHGFFPFPPFNLLEPDVDASGCGDCRP